MKKPKPQIQFAVWKGRNEHRGKETSLAAARSVEITSDAPPEALSFLSQEKRQGRKECLGTRGLYCSAIQAGNQFEDFCNRIGSQYVRFGTRRPSVWVSNLFLSAFEWVKSIEGAFEIC